MNLRQLPRNVWVVTATSFLTDISSEMISYLIPLYLNNVLGVGANIIGLIDGLAEMTASLLKLFSGWLSDKLASRKWLTVSGYSVSTIAKMFLLIANTWPVVLIIRLAERTGKGLRTSPRDALVADSVAESQRGIAFGFHRAGDTAGAALGLLTALIVVYLAEGTQAQITAATFFLFAGLSIIPAVLAVLVLALGAHETANPLQATLPKFSLAGFDRRFKYFLIVVVLFTLGNSSDTFIVLRAQNLGANLITILAMILFFNILYALIAGPAGQLSDRFGRKRIIVLGWAIYGLVYLGFALAGVVWQVFVWYILYGLYYALTEGVGKALIADLVPKDQRGTAYGLYNGALGLAAFPASFIAGILWSGLGPFQGFGPSAPFIFGATLALLAAILLIFL